MHLRIINGFSADKTNGFVIPWMEKDEVFLYSNDSMREVESLKKYLITLLKGDLIEKIENISNVDMHLKTVTHEHGHLLTFKKIGNYMKSDFNWGEVKDKIPEFEKYLILLKRQSNRFRINNYDIGEFVAEDYRIAFAEKMKQDTQYVPNHMVYDEDWEKPEPAKERRDIIFKILTEDEKKWKKKQKNLSMEIRRITKGLWKREGSLQKKRELLSKNLSIEKSMFIKLDRVYKIIKLKRLDKKLSLICKIIQKKKENGIEEVIGNAVRSFESSIENKKFK